MGFAVELSAALFVFGLAVGSFLNALIYRLSASSRSILDSHSICPRCQQRLAWYDLIPIASFFMLGGRCRYCRKPISWQYPAVELATAVSFVLIYFSTSPAFQSPSPGGLGRGEVELLFNLVAASFLIIIFVYDLKHYLILDKVLLPAAVLALLYQAYQGNLGMAILGGALLAGFFGFLYLVSRGRWIGLGDVKLGVFLGLLIPWPVTLALFFLAYLSGAMVSLWLLALRAKKMTDRLPFGTFLTFGAFIAMLWGEEMMNWYFRLIGI